MSDLPERLRAMAAEWDDPMCSENPVHPLLLEAASEIETAKRMQDPIMTENDLELCERWANIQAPNVKPDEINWTTMVRRLVTEIRRLKAAQ